MVYTSLLRVISYRICLQGITCRAATSEGVIAEKGIFVVVALLILLSWRAQLALALTALLLLICKHWIIGGLLGVVASVAFITKGRF